MGNKKESIYRLHSLFSTFLIIELYIRHEGVSLNYCSKFWSSFFLKKLVKEEWWLRNLSWWWLFLLSLFLFKFKLWLLAFYHFPSLFTSNPAPSSFQTWYCRKIIYYLHWRKGWKMHGNNRNTPWKKC